MGNKFFLEEIFLRRNFGEHVLKERIPLGEEILPAKFFGVFFGSKCHSGEEKNTGYQKCFGEERYGEQTF